MDDVSRVHVEQSTEHLVDEVLDVVFGEILLAIDDAMQVGLHEFGDDVDVGVAGLALRLEQINQSDYVFVREKLCR